MQATGDEDLMRAVHGNNEVYTHLYFSLRLTLNFVIV